MGHSEVVSPIMTLVSVLIVANVFVYREAQQGAGDLGGFPAASLASGISFVFVGIALFPALYFLWLLGSGQPIDGIFSQKFNNPNGVLALVIFCLMISSYLLFISIGALIIL